MSPCDKIVATLYDMTIKGEGLSCMSTILWVRKMVHSQRKMELVDNEFDYVFPFRHGTHT
jgi:hypothetical protein